MSHSQLILASTSFRRRELLSWLQAKFEVVAPDFEEPLLDGMEVSDPEELIKGLAVGKALSLIDQYPDSWIIGGDTVVFLGNLGYGKPRDLDHAREILHILSGKTHQVITAAAVVSPKRELDVGAESSDVTFRKLSDAEIEKYIQTSESLGKAGAYAMLHGARPFVQEVHGSLSSIIGLPLPLLEKMMKKTGFKFPIKAADAIKDHLNHVDILTGPLPPQLSIN